MKPIHIKGMQRSNCWQPARRVWFQKNDDEEAYRDSSAAAFAESNAVERFMERGKGRSKRKIEEPDFGD